jgi:hypothetical protein
MREETAQDQAGYLAAPSPVAHGRDAGGHLPAGSANAYLMNATVLPASLALAGPVAVRRRFPASAESGPRPSTSARQ